MKKIKPNSPETAYSVAFAVIELEKLYPNDADLGKRIRKLVSDISNGSDR